MFPTPPFHRTLLSTPVTEDSYSKTPHWPAFDHEAEQLPIKKLEQWFSTDDEVDHAPSTPPYLITSSDDNMSGNQTKYSYSGANPDINSLRPPPTPQPSKPPHIIPVVNPRFDSLPHPGTPHPSTLRSGTQSNHPAFLILWTPRYQTPHVKVRSDIFASF